MLLELVALLFTAAGVLGNECEEYCDHNETCCVTPTLDVLCCPLVNAVCCEDWVNCCPEGSFCDMNMNMCGRYFIPEVDIERSGDIESDEEIPTDTTQSRHEKRDTLDQPYTNEITNMDHMLVHCDLNQFCPYFSTCCRTKEDNISLCCPNPEGVCCSDEEHCCKRGEECDSRGVFCISEVGLETIVRKAEDLRYHYEKRGLDFVESDVVKGTASSISETRQSD